MLLEARTVMVGKQTFPGGIIFYGDLDCDPCKREWARLTALIPKMSKQVIHYRHFPLVSLHPAAFDKACLLEYAKTQNATPRVFEYLSTKTGKTVSLKDVSRDCAIEVPTVTVLRKRFGPLVQSDIQLGQSMGVKATPAVFTVTKSGKLKQFSDQDLQ